MLTEISILVVEDEFMIAHDLEQQMLRLGAQVYVAFSLANGIATFTAHRAALDLAMLDVNLGDDDVLPLAEMIRDAEIPIVFHSAEAQLHEGLPQHFPDAALIEKPATEPEVLGAILRLVSRSAP